MPHPNCFIYRSLRATLMACSLFGLPFCSKSNTPGSNQSISKDSQDITVSATFDLTSSASAALSIQRTDAALSALKLYCVTFQTPPASGEAQLDDQGHVEVLIKNAVGQAIGCFVRQGDKTLASLEFQSDNVGLGGGSSAESTVSLKGNTDLGKVSLDLVSKKAVVKKSDMKPSKNDPRFDKDSAAPFKTFSGSGFDFSGTYQLAAVSESELPAGTSGICAKDAQNCDGPKSGEVVILERLAAKAWTLPQACIDFIKQKNNKKEDNSNVNKIPDACSNGEKGNGDRYAIRIWGSAKAKDTCGPYLGFSNEEARLYGQMDFSDSSYKAGPFPWSTQIELNGIKSSIEDGWKIDAAISNSDVYMDTKANTEQIGLPSNLNNGKMPENMILIARQGQYCRDISSCDKTLQSCDLTLELAEQKCFARYFDNYIRQSFEQQAVCLRDLQPNYNAHSPMEFVQNQGPDKVLGMHGFEIFNYTAEDAGSFVQRHQNVYPIFVSADGNVGMKGQNAAIDNPVCYAFICKELDTKCSQDPNNSDCQKQWADNQCDAVKQCFAETCKQKGETSQECLSCKEQIGCKDINMPKDPVQTGPDTMPAQFFETATLDQIKQYISDSEYKLIQMAQNKCNQSIAQPNAELCQKNPEDYLCKIFAMVKAQCPDLTAVAESDLRNATVVNNYIKQYEPHAFCKRIVVGQCKVVDCNLPEQAQNPMCPPDCQQIVTQGRWDMRCAPQCDKVSSDPRCQYGDFCTKEENKDGKDCKLDCQKMPQDARCNMNQLNYCDRILMAMNQGQPVSDADKQACQKPDCNKQENMNHPFCVQQQYCKTHSTEAACKPADCNKNKDDPRCKKEQMGRHIPCRVEESTIITLKHQSDDSILIQWQNQNTLIDAQQECQALKNKVDQNSNLMFKLVK